MEKESRPKGIDDLSPAELVNLVMDVFRRTLAHYAFWFAETHHQWGLEKAVAIESEAGDAVWSVMLKRLSQTFGFEVVNGVPKRLQEMEKDTLIKLLDAVSANWLASDGIWFQTIEKRFGMDGAKRCNDTCWLRFSPYEAARVKKMLGLPEQSGLEGLKRALGFRVYARINKQSIHEVDDNSFIFRMDSCRVQWARKSRGLADYPCKSIGLVEYPSFASGIDARIQTECIACPPDEHPEGWFCAWKFSID